MRARTSLTTLNNRIIACERCPRLRTYCRRVAQEKRASFRDQTYWGRPVPNLLGEEDGGRLLVVGLAPAAHGANRTGRMFTGDRSGDFLFRAMHGAGFCNQPVATGPNDGLRLLDATISAPVHCAPPDNKPTAEEIARCHPFLEATFEAMPRLCVVVCLGGIAHRSVLRLYKARGWVRALADHRFAHGAMHRFAAAPTLIDSYHPSQQNTFTGRLTDAMLLAVFEQARAEIAERS